MSIILINETATQLKKPKLEVNLVLKFKKQPYKIKKGHPEVNMQYSTLDNNPTQKNGMTSKDQHSFQHKTDVFTIC